MIVLLEPHESSSSVDSLRELEGVTIVRRQIGTLSLEVVHDGRFYDLTEIETIAGEVPIPVRGYQRDYFSKMGVPVTFTPNPLIGKQHIFELKDGKPKPTDCMPSMSEAVRRLIEQANSLNPGVIEGVEFYTPGGNVIRDDGFRWIVSFDLLFKEIIVGG